MCGGGSLHLERCNLACDKGWFSTVWWQFRRAVEKGALTGSYEGVRE